MFPLLSTPARSSVQGKSHSELAAAFKYPYMSYLFSCISAPVKGGFLSCSDPAKALCSIPIEFIPDTFKCHCLPSSRAVGGFSSRLLSLPLSGLAGILKQSYHIPKQSATQSGVFSVFGTSFDTAQTAVKPRFSKQISVYPLTQTPGLYIIQYKRTRETARTKTGKIRWT